MAQERDENFFGREKIGRILLKLAPPVMLAQLIQALYNIVASFLPAVISLMLPVTIRLQAIRYDTCITKNKHRNLKPKAE